MTTRAWEPTLGGRYPMHHAKPRLTPQQREEVAIRRHEGETTRDLASEYGVSAALIRAIQPHGRA